MENNNCHFQVGGLVTANLSWQLALPILVTTPIAKVLEKIVVESRQSKKSRILSGIT